MKKVLLSALVISSVFFSCKKNKDDDPNPTNKSTTELLTQHSWKLTAATADKDVDVTDDGNANASSNVYAQRPGCSNDDVVTFTNSSSTPKTGSLDAGATKCGSEDQSRTFNWSLSNGETILTLSALFYAQQYTIIEITNTKLKVRYDATDQNGTAYVATDTYEKP